MKKILVLALLLAGCAKHSEGDKLAAISHFKLTDFSQLDKIADDCEDLKGLGKESKVSVHIYNGTSVREWSRLAYPNFNTGKKLGFDKGAYAMEYLNLGLNKKKRSEFIPGDVLTFTSPERMGVEVDLDSSFVRAVVEKRVILTGITAKKY